MKPLPCSRASSRRYLPMFPSFRRGSVPCLSLASSSCSRSSFTRSCSAEPVTGSTKVSKRRNGAALLSCISLRNRDRVKVCINKQVEFHRVQPPGFLKHAHETDTGKLCTGITGRQVADLLLFHRHIGHREPAHDHEEPGVQYGRPARDLHTDVLNVHDLLCLCLVQQGHENLFGMKSPHCNGQEFDKRSTGTGTAIVYDLVPFVDPEVLHIFLKRPQEPGDPPETLICHVLERTRGAGIRILEQRR